MISSKMLYNGDDSEVDNRTMRSTCEYLLPPLPPSLDFECHPQAVALSGRREREERFIKQTVAYQSE